MNKLTTRLGYLLLVAALGLIGILAIAFFGQANRHSGRLELSLVNSQADRFVYEGRVQTNSFIFRPNSLFVVENPVARCEPHATISCEWIREDAKGLVRIESPIELVDPPKAEFSLRIRWTKLAPMLALLLILTLSWLHWRWQVQNQNSNSMRLSELASVEEKLPAKPVGSDYSNAHFWISHLILLLMLAYYILHVLWPIGWIYGDSHYFLATVAKGEFTAGASFEEAGRFFPLAFLDLNVLLPFGNTSGRVAATVQMVACHQRIPVS